MSISSAIDNIKEEGASLSKEVRSGVESLDFSLDSVLVIKEKYNAIGLDTLGQNYDRMVTDRSLPPLNPTKLFDQERLGAVSIIATGEVFLPRQSTNNLVSLQELYLDLGSDLSAAREELANNPPREPSDDRFSILANKYEVRIVSRLKHNGLAKSRADIVTELNTNNFESFVFTENPSLLFIVYPRFIGKNQSLGEFSKAANTTTDNVALRTVWYGSLNTSTSNLNKMRVKYGLNPRQIRVAAFGDDVAAVNTGFFNDLIAQMNTALNAVDPSYGREKVVRALQKTRDIANIFLAQVSFYTTTIVDSSIVDDLLEAGITTTELELSLSSRTDGNFSGIEAKANALSSIVFPARNNKAERILLASSLSQATKSPNFTTPFLNIPFDYRKILVTEVKKLVASLSSKLLILERTSTLPSVVAQSLATAKVDVQALSNAYSNFISPPASAERVIAVPSMESPCGLLLRSTDVIKSLRIQDQIDNFPTDVNGNLEANLVSILDGLSSLTTSIHLYLDEYRVGELRDFLATVISVSSMTNFLLADGNPKRSLIVKERPERINVFKESVQTNILNAHDSVELYRLVSIQIETLWGFLIGNEDTDPVGKLLDLPISMIDSVIDVLSLSASQRAALVQLRESFNVLSNVRISINRDLTAYRASFMSAVADAHFLLSRLSGSAISELVAELGQI